MNTTKLGWRINSQKQKLLHLSDLKTIEVHTLYLSWIVENSNMNIINYFYAALNLYQRQNVFKTIKQIKFN